MATVRIEVNSKAVKALLRGPEVQRDLRRRAEAIARQAGEGFEANVTVGPHRARATVRTVTPDAARAEARDRTLTRALDAGRA